VPTVKTARPSAIERLFDKLREPPAGEMTGEPNQGDLDGSGTAHLTVNPGTSEVCWTIEVTRVEPITEAHIHKAPSTTNGPVVVPFAPDYPLAARRSAGSWR
jgi:hypothetical protein